MDERRRGRGHEAWLRTHGMRPGPVYTMIQIGIVALAIALAVAILPQVGG